MGILESLFNGIRSFMESEETQKFIENAREKQAEREAVEKARTTGINGLRCIVDNVNDNGYIVECEGTVKNVGKSIYDKVSVTVTFKNENGSIVDKKIARPVLFENFYPGEAVVFNTTSNAKNVHSASAKITEYHEIS